MIVSRENQSLTPLPLPPGSRILFSLATISTTLTHWRVLAWHLICRARSRALATAGRRRPARMAMMAMTTSSSIRVKAVRRIFMAD